MHCRPLIVFDIFLLLDSFREGHIYDIIVLNTNHDGALLFQQSRNSSNTQSAGENTVLSSRRTTTLEMA